MGNYLSQFFNSVFGGGQSLGNQTSNAVTNFNNNIPLKPSTIKVDAGDVNNMNQSLLSNIQKFGSGLFGNQVYGAGGVAGALTGNPLVGVGTSAIQSLLQNRGNAQNGSGASLNGTLSGTNTQAGPGSAYGNGFGGGVGYGNVNTNTQTTTSGQNGNTSTGNGNTSSFDFSTLENGTQTPQTTPEGLAYLNSLNGYQGRLLDFQTQADEQHNKEIAQINAQMQNIKNKQEQENLYQAEAARQAGISTGLAYFTPQLYQSGIRNVMDSGLEKLADITVKQNGLVLEADKASLAQKREILTQLQDLQKQRLDVTRQMKDDIRVQTAYEDQRNENIIARNLPAIYDQLEKLPEEQKQQFLVQASQRLGVPASQLISSYRTFGQKENQGIADIYNSIAQKLSTTNPQLALEIAQKSMTPEGRKELMNSPYFKALSALGSASGLFGNAPTNISETTPDAVRNAIFGQESGGNYKAVNKDSGALGKYQIMPQYWFSKIGLDPNSQADKQKFLNSPNLQDTLFNYILNDASQKYNGDLKKIIASYYGGALGAQNVGTPQGDIQGAIKDGKPTGYPSVNQYVQQVLSRIGGSSSLGGSQNQQQALQLAKQNLASLGGTKVNIQALQGINNPSTLWSKAASTLSTAQEKQDAAGALAMTKIAPKLVELRNLVGEENFGLLATTDQKFKQLYGGTRGQEVSRLMSEITNLLQVNRNSITGAAWGKQEDKEYVTKLPTSKDSVAAYFGKLEGLLDASKVNAQSTIGNVIGGDDIFNALYGNMFNINGSSSGGVNKVTINGKSYNLPY